MGDAASSDKNDYAAMDRAMGSSMANAPGLNPGASTWGTGGGKDGGGGISAGAGRTNIDPLKPWESLKFAQNPLDQAFGGLNADPMAQAFGGTAFGDQRPAFSGAFNNFDPNTYDSTKPGSGFVGYDGSGAAAPAAKPSGFVTALKNGIPELGKYLVTGAAGTFLSGVTTASPVVGAIAGILTKAALSSDTAQNFMDKMFTGQISMEQADQLIGSHYNWAQSGGISQQESDAKMNDVLSSLARGDGGNAGAPAGNRSNLFPEILAGNYGPAYAATTANNTAGAQSAGGPGAQQQQAAGPGGSGVAAGSGVSGSIYNNPMWGMYKAAAEKQYALAKEKAMENRPSGGGLMDSLTDLSGDKARFLAGAAGDIYQQEWNLANTIADREDTQAANLELAKLGSKTQTKIANTYSDQQSAQLKAQKNMWEAAAEAEKEAQEAINEQNMWKGAADVLDAFDK